MFLFFSLTLIILFSPLDCNYYYNSLETNTKDVKLNLDEESRIEIFLENDNFTATSSPLLYIDFHCDSTDSFCRTFRPENISLILSKNQTKTSLSLTAISAGHDVIVFSANRTEVDDSDAFVRVRVGRSQVWNILAQVVGWTYFLVWSASFWPQNVINYRRKSVVGYNLDFAALNVTGFLFYAIYNSGLYFSAHVQREYEQKFPRSEIPIELNDVIYALHASLATGITLVQCYVYERGDQSMSLLGKLFTLSTWSAALIQVILCALKVESWLTFLYYFSYVKLVVTSVKYLPQAWFNYKRKSTKGWSILMIYLDFCGGINGLLQMLFIAHQFDDWKTIFGNFAKFGLSLASISYDIIFFLQEYLFYRGREPISDQKKKSDVSLATVNSQSEKRRKQSIISIVSTKSVQQLRRSFNYGMDGKNLI